MHDCLNADLFRIDILITVIAGYYLVWVKYSQPTSEVLTLWPYQRLKDYSLFTLTSAIKGANCVECKLIHCEYRASKGVDYQSMPLQCIGVFWFYMFPTCNLDDFGIKRCGI